MVRAKCFYAVDKITYAYRFGHKKTEWSKKKVKDLLLAITENFKYSAKYNFKKLNEYTFVRFQQHYPKIKNIIDLELIGLIETMFEYNSELKKYCKKKMLIKFKYYTGLNRLLKIFQKIKNCI